MQISSNALKIKGIAFITHATLFIDLFRETASSTSPNPKVSFIEEVFDVRSWLNVCLESLHGHSSPHCFKFVPDDRMS